MIDEYLQNKLNYWKAEVQRISEYLEPNDPWDEMALSLAQQELDKYTKLVQTYEKEKT